MKKLGMGILTMMLLLIALAFVIVGAPFVTDSGTAYAGLAKAQNVGLSGVNYSDSLGNTTGAFTGRRISKNEFPDELNCFFAMTNASGVIVANTATATIETSIDNVDWDLFENVTVAASTVTGIRNTGSAAQPFGNYYRVNISAIQNANASYMRSRCLIE